MDLINDLAETFFLWGPIVVAGFFISWAIIAGIKIGIEILVDKIKASKERAREE